MPKVGKKKYSYTKAGMKKARAAAKKSGKKVRFQTFAELSKFMEENTKRQKAKSKNGKAKRK